MASVTGIRCFVFQTKRSRDIQPRAVGRCAASREFTQMFTVISVCLNNCRTGRQRWRARYSRAVIQRHVSFRSASAGSRGNRPVFSHDVTDISRVRATARHRRGHARLQTSFLDFVDEFLSTRRSRRVARTLRNGRESIEILFVS